MLGDEVKKKLLEEKDILEQAGQKSESKAKPVIEQVMKEKEKVEEKKETDYLTLLHDARGYPLSSYNKLLANLLLARLKEVDFPRDWGYQVSPTDIGVVMEIYSPIGKIYRAAFKPTGEAKYDLNAINTYGIRAENTIDRITHQGQKSPHGENSNETR